MLLTNNSADFGTMRCAEAHDYTAHWTGLVFFDGIRAGADSVKQLMRELSDGISITNAADRLRGLFFIVVEDKRRNQIFAFTDPSGLLHVFHSDSAVSTSFLDLAAHHRLCSRDIDVIQLVEFLHFGYLSFARTFFNLIARMNPGQIACFHNDSDKISFIPGPSQDIAGEPRHSLEQLIESFSRSVAAEHVSVDLTGGIDSRLIAVLLSSVGLRFEAAVRGEPDSSEVLTAQSVADQLGVNLHIHPNDASNFETSIPSLFRISDGLFDLCVAHGPLQVQEDRRRRGITLMISGVGGELFKDFWWLQDFPFYGWKRPDLAKLYVYRIAPKALRHDYIASRYQAISRNHLARFLIDAQRFVADRNTSTYDQLYYYVKMRDLVGRFVSNHISVLTPYAPYLEIHAARVGYHLPPTKRFFNRFHRELTTHYNAAVASIPTTEGGISVSSETLRLFCDLSRYTHDKFRRATHKLANRRIRKLRATTPSSTQLGKLVRRNAETHNAFEQLKERGILNPAVTVDNLDDDYVGRVLTLGMLLSYLDEAPHHECLVPLYGRNPRRVA